MIQKELGKTGFKVSPIGLGTVEIGLVYDIKDKTLPAETTAMRILKSAVDLGVTYFDTARGYGLAEERIGKAGISKINGVVIGTKCAQFLEKGEDPRGPELEKRIRDEVGESLRCLKVDSLQLLQLHGGNKEQIERGELQDILRHLQEEGKIQHFGIATRGEEAALAALQGEPRPDGRAAATPFFETMQIAYSILDQRLAPQTLPQAKTKNIGIINRSVLLKGSLTPKRDVLPPELSPLKQAADKAETIAHAAGLTLPELAIRFCLSSSAISTALIGTIETKHLSSALAAAAAGPLPKDILAELYKLAIDDPEQVDPARWPKF